MTDAGDGVASRVSSRLSFARLYSWWIGEDAAQGGKSASNRVSALRYADSISLLLDGTDRVAPGGQIKVRLYIMTS